jgi:hypothetical protein
LRLFNEVPALGSQANVITLHLMALKALYAASIHLPASFCHLPDRHPPCRGEADVFMRSSL